MFTEYGVVLGETKPLRGAGVYSEIKDVCRLPMTEDSVFRSENTVSRKLSREWTRNGKALPVVLFVLLAFLSGVLWQESRKNSRKELKAYFDVKANQFSARINQRILEYEQVLRGLQGLFVASDEVSRTEYRNYYNVLKLEENFPGLQALGYAIKINPSELNQTISKVRGEGFPAFSVNPPGDRDLYTMIVYIEPFSGRNLRAFGYDMYSEKTRHAAMDRAMRSGKSALSGKVELIQESGRNVQAGVLLYLPLYKKTMPTYNEAEREKAIQGWVYAAFRMGDFINSFIHEFHDELDVRIVSGSDNDKKKELFCSDTVQTRPLESKYRVLNQLDIEGQVWTIHIASKPALEAKLDTERPRLILLSGIGISIICSFLVWFLVYGRLRAIRLVEEYEERSKLMMQQANESIVLVDRDRRFVDANTQTTKYFGYPLSELLTLRIDDVIPPLEARGIAKRFEELMQRGPQRLETQIVKKDGTVTNAEISAQVVPYKGQQYLLGFVRDISDQKRWEAAIKASEEKLRALFELSFEFIGQLTPDGKLVDANKPLLEFMHTTLEGVKGTNLWSTSLFAHDIEMKNLMTDAVAKAAAGSTVRIEMTVMRYDETVHTVDLSLKPLLRGKAMPELLILEARDISDRKQTELQLKKYSEELALSNAAKDKFFSIISHDLRGPFHGFLSAAEMLANGASFMNKDAMISLSKSLHTSLQQQFELLNSLLQWSRLQSGKMELLQDILYLSKDAEKIIGALKLSAKDKTIELVNEIPDNCVAFADRNMTHLLLRNLLTNAIKFTGIGGKVTIAAANEKNHVRVWITDTGVGMAPEEIRKLFRLDVQHTTTGTASERGSGLGLLLCKEVVEKHGGTITIESQPMKGSTFSFTLPNNIPQAVPLP